MSTMKVIAAPGIAVPKEHAPRDYISDAEAVDVPASTYYLRALADGDLLPVAAANPDDKTAAKTPVKKGAE